MAGSKKQRLLDLNDGIRLVITDQGLDYGNRFTAVVYAADGKCCGSPGSGSDFDEDPGAAPLKQFIDNARKESEVEHFAAEYDLCILKALSASAGK